MIVLFLIPEKDISTFYLLVRHVSADYIVWPFNTLKSGFLLIFLVGLFAHSLVTSVNMRKKYGSPIWP